MPLHVLPHVLRVRLVESGGYLYANWKEEPFVLEDMALRQDIQFGEQNKR